MEYEYTCLLSCNVAEYPFGYLGIPMHHRQLLNSEWHKVEERLKKHLSFWKAKHMSYGERLVLLPMFMMSFF
jgi:hypothetical protein